MAAINAVTDFSVEGDVGVVTLNSPPVNALSAVVREGLKGAFEAAIAAGADVFLTGEISEPQAHYARETGVARAELMATADGRQLYDRAGFCVAAFPAPRTRSVRVCSAS